jgi:hypothetical protein
VQLVGLSNTHYQDVIDIGVSVVSGFLVQLLGWVLLLPFVGSTAKLGDILPTLLGIIVVLVAVGIAVLGPLAAVGYGIYRYLTWVGPGQARVTTAFVGALLIKVFVIPLIKAIVTGTALKLVIRWLRGGKK